LEKLGEAVAPALREVLAGEPSAETRRRAQSLLEKLAGRNHLSSDRLRSLRAIEVLEKIGTPEARQVLKTVATGVEASLQTRAAREALGRLGQK
jgi:hypothetical protein